MTTSIFKTTATALAATLMAASTALTAQASTAERQFQVEFQFSRTQPAEQVYANFQEVAENACKLNGRITVARFPARVIRICEQNLLDNAVMKSNFPALIDLHRAHTGRVDVSGKTSES